MLRYSAQRVGSPLSNAATLVPLFLPQALDAAFTSLQAQAVECSLANVAPAGSSGVWTDEAIAAFEEIVFSSENTLLIAVGQSATGRHEVMLLADSVDVAWDLSTKGHAFCNYKAAGTIYCMF